MKTSRRLGLVALVGAALTMTVGVSSASASAFLGKGNSYPATLKSTANLAVTLKTGELSMKCTLPAFEKTIVEMQRTFTTTGADGLCTSYKGTQTTLAMNGCKLILEPGAETAANTFEGYVSPDTSCSGKKIVADFAFSSCTKYEYTPNSYTSAKSEFQNKGSYPNKSIAFGVSLSGLAWSNSCSGSGSNGSLDISWEMTQGEGWVEVAGISPANTVLCKEEKAPCPVSSRYQTNSSFTPSGKATIAFNIYGLTIGIDCKGSALPVFVAPVALSGALPTTNSDWILSECLLGGNVNWSCTATTINLPYKGELSSAGTLTVTSGGSGAPGWRVTCAANGLDCTYQFEPTLSVEGGTISGNKLPLSASPNVKNGCPGSNPVFIANYGSSRKLSTDE